MGINAKRGDWVGVGVGGVQVSVVLQAGGDLPGLTTPLHDSTPRLHSTTPLHDSTTLLPAPRVSCLVRALSSYS